MRKTYIYIYRERERKCAREGGKNQIGIIKVFSKRVYIYIYI